MILRTHRWSPPKRSWTLAVHLALMLGFAGSHALRAADVVVIGDSLSAEYEMVPDFPGVENPTEYARVSVAGWESMSWVEVLARLRGSFFGFGRFRADLPGWNDLRFSGYEFNFAIPGFRAAQYEDIVNSSFFSNPQHLLFRSTLQVVLRNEAEWVVIWLGANEFRANYGFLSDGGDAAPLIANLTGDLREVIEFVQQQRTGLKVVIANLPDLGAAPDKRKSHPDPAKRALVTAATKQANAAIAALAASKGVAVADVFSQTERLIHGTNAYFGAVEIIGDTHPDNSPRYAFTRDGLHPNTPSQLEIANEIIASFNSAHSAAVPKISDAEALKFLGLRPNEPYFDWIERYAVAANRMEDDPDHDGLANLVELAFGLDPSVPNRSPVTSRLETSAVRMTYLPSPNQARLVDVIPQHSSNLQTWNDLPGTNILINADGSRTVLIPISEPTGFLRLTVAVRQLE